MAEKSATFLNSIDTTKVTDLLNQTDINSDYFTSITNQVVKAYTLDLDTFIDKVNNDRLDSINNKLSTDQLEGYILQLSNILYYLGERLENVGIKDDVSKAARQEVYNKAYLANDIEQENDSGKKIKPTKDANQAVAEEQSKYENIVNNIYSRTYKIIKFKIDQGIELLGSIKKILSRRMQEVDLSMYQPRGNV